MLDKNTDLNTEHSKHCNENSTLGIEFNLISEWTVKCEHCTVNSTMNTAKHWADNEMLNIILLNRS